MSLLDREYQARLAQALEGPLPAPPAPAPKPRKAPRARGLDIGCLPMKGANNAPVPVLDAYSGLVREVCAAFNVPHVGLVDFGKGWSALVG